MQQYFMEESLQLNSIVRFSNEQAHHIKKVMRMKEKELVRVVDVQAQPFLAEIQYQGQEVLAHCIKALENTQEKIKITLIQGMIKKDKWDFLLQKACELGVHEIIPMISSRCVVKIDDRDTKKLERYNKIALEACEQCKRDHIVHVQAPIAFKDIIHYQKQLNIVAYEEEDFSSHSLKNVLNDYPDVQEIVYVVGCEGGFSTSEIEYLKAHNFACVSLGKRILRAETAAISLINTTLYHYE